MESTRDTRAYIEMLEFGFDVLIRYVLSVIPQVSTQRETVFVSHITQLLKAKCLSYLKRHDITSSSLYSPDFGGQKTQKHKLTNKISAEILQNLQLNVGESHKIITFNPKTKT